jgi:translation initiation factor IF-1
VPGEDAIYVAGVIVEVLGDGLFRAELKNGHKLLAHGSRRNRDKLAALKLGETVNLELSPFDMSKGRILI